MILKKDTKYISFNNVESIDIKDQPITFMVKTVSGEEIQSSIYPDQATYNLKLQEINTKQLQAEIVDI